MNRRKQKSHFHSKSSTPGIISIRDEILWIEAGDFEIFWDAGAFRPDPRENLIAGRKYKASIVFDTENLPSGMLIKFPQKITLDSKSKKIFVNVR